MASEKESVDPLIARHIFPVFLLRRLFSITRVNTNRLPSKLSFCWFCWPGTWAAYGLCNPATIPNLRGIAGSEPKRWLFRRGFFCSALFREPVLVILKDLERGNQGRAVTPTAILSSLKKLHQPEPILGHVEPRTLVGRVSNKICSPHALGSVGPIFLTLTHWQKSN